MKRTVQLPAHEAARLAIADAAPPAGLAAVVAAVRPTILIGTTGTAGSFGEAVLRALGPTGRPIVMPLSNPTASTEATPEEVLRWTDGRAIVATGSPFPPVAWDGGVREVSQANNVYIFPGLGLGAIVAEASEVSDAMIMAAARTLAAMVSVERLAGGNLYPPIEQMRVAAHAIAIAVARRAVADGQARIDPATDVEAAVDAAIWWPDYVPYTPGSAAG